MTFVDGGKIPFWKDHIQRGFRNDSETTPPIVGENSDNAVTDGLAFVEFGYDVTGKHGRMVICALCGKKFQSQIPRDLGGD